MSAAVLLAVLLLGAPAANRALAAAPAGPGTPPAAPASGIEPARVRAGAPAGALRTVEGRVAAVGEAVGEGELPLLTLRLDTAEGPLQVLVAPATALADAGFRIAVGDQVRARVFLAPDGDAAHAQKLLNRTQALMVHLRTLRQEPLWDAAGRWQGETVGAASGAGRTAVRPQRRRQPTRRPEPPPPRPRGDGGEANRIRQRTLSDMRRLQRDVAVGVAEKRAQKRGLARLTRPGDERRREAPDSLLEDP